MKNHKLLLFALLFLLIGINYSFIDSLLVKAFEEPYETVIIQRVIDGDTVVAQSTTKEAEEFRIRMLGINSPEHDEVGFDDAKDFLIREIEGREVKLRFGKDKTDRYSRTLAYIFLDGRNINLDSVRKGYSSFYFPSGKDKYYSLFFDAWQECLNLGIGICRESKENCIEIDWNPKEDLVRLRNVCSHEIDLNGWSVKDEGRKKFVFESKILENGESVFLSSSDFDKNYVWTNSGDSIFVRDGENGLVFWESY